MDLNTAKRAGAAVLMVLLIPCVGSTDAFAQDDMSLHAACTNEQGSLFRIDNNMDREFDFTLREDADDGTRVSGSAYPIGEGGAYVYLPSGATAVLEVRGEEVATAEANMDGCAASMVDTGRPVCEGIGFDTETREALFATGADMRGISRIDITVDNGTVLVYDPHATFVLDAGGTPAPVFEVTDGTATFDPGVLFNAGYGLLLKGDASGKVAFFATVHSPGGTTECDPQFATASEEDAELPQEVMLDQNYPNPFNPSTEIDFTLAEQGQVTLRVYDVLGRKVATLVDGRLSAGTHTVTWNGRDDAGQAVASGTYLYRLETGDVAQTRVMTLLK